MPRKKVSVIQQQIPRSFHFEYKNTAQKLAWAAVDQHDMAFLLGPAGTGKTMIAMAYAISEVISGRKKKIVLTRPLVEAGEKLGYLPGNLDDKVDPYMLPLYDCMSRVIGYEGPQRNMIERNIERAPLAYLRGRTFTDSVCILDEAQNCSKMQLKLFLTRLGDNSKMVITGDPKQSDLSGSCALMEIVNLLKPVPGIGFVEFFSCSIVRHPLVSAVLEALGD